MKGQARHVAAEMFTLPTAAGPSKVLSLHDAVRRFVRPGQSIHLAVTHYRPTALLFELCRQYWGTQPGFTLACIGFRENGTVPVFGGLVSRLISPIFFDLYPTPSPNPVFQAAYRAGQVQFESWSMLTLTLRLMAGAMGIPFLPTRSLVGSSMAKDHPDAFKVIEDPFGGEPIGLVKALQPDVSFVHALAADQWGNALLTPPYGETWGMLAARDGVIVSAERIVSSDVICRHSHLMRLPGHRTLAVVEAPFGAHPGGMFAEMADGFDTYGEDYEFQEEYRSASRDPECFEAWIRRWVLTCGDHREYVERLGPDRPALLRRRGSRDIWQADFDEALSTLEPERAASVAEVTAVLAVRLIAERVRTAGHDMILAGVGLPHLAAWVAGQTLRHEGVPVQLALETGLIGYQPRAGDSFIFNFGNLHTATGLTDILHVLGVYVSGPTTRCLGVLGIGQIDRFGNLNTTVAADGAYLVGSGGANDVASGADECIAVGAMSAQRFVTVLPYVTSPGRTIRHVVTDGCILSRPSADAELTLTHCVVAPGGSLEAAVRDCRSRCGWDLAAAATVEPLSRPTPAELMPLRLLDPKAWFLR